jgi:5-hydroxyisourate hydrolase
MIMFLSQTDADGRCMNFSNNSSPGPWTLGKGLYKITFQTKEYFESSGRQSFYPVVEVCDIFFHPRSMDGSPRD